MTACKDSLSGKKAVSATLAGVLAVGMVPAAAFAETAQADTTGEQGVELQTAGDVTAFNNGSITAAKFGDTAVKDVKKITTAATDEAQKLVPTKITTASGVVVDLTDEKVAKQFKVTYQTADEKGNPTGTEVTAPTDPGKYAVVVEGVSGDYAGGKLSLSYDITPASLGTVNYFEVNEDAAAGRETDDKVLTYTGNALEIGFTSTVGKKVTVLEEGKDYTVKFVKAGSSIDADGVDVVDADSYVAVINGLGKYAATDPVQVPVTVKAFDLSKATIAVDDVVASNAVPTAPTSVKIVADDGTAATLADPSLVKLAFVSGPAQTFSKAGQYTFSASKADDKNKNVAGAYQGLKYKDGKESTEEDATVSNNLHVNKVQKAATFKYDGEAVPSTFSTDLSKTGAKVFDANKIKGYNGKNELNGDFDVLDKDGNSVKAKFADGKIDEAGTFTVKYTVDPADTEYVAGGSVETVVTVIAGSVDADATAYVKYDDKTITSLEKAYNGTGIANNAFTVTVTSKNEDGNVVTLKKDTDYKVSFKDAKGKEVGTFKDAGEYTVEITSDTYAISGNNVVKVTITPADLTKLELPTNTTRHNFVDKGTTDSAFTAAVKYFTGEKDADGEAIKAAVEAAFGSDVNVTVEKKNDEGEWKAAPTTYTEGEYRVTVAPKTDEKAANFTFAGEGKTVVEFTVADAAKYKFDDVTPDSWAFDAVAAVSKGDGFAGYMNGYNGTKIFGANDTITRGQVACVLFNLAGGETDHHYYGGDNSFSEIEGYKSFDDVNGKMYYGQAIAWAKSAGVVNGYADGTFRPDQAVTREEFACMLANYAQKTGAFKASDGSALAKLADAGQVSAWAKDSVAWAVENKLMGNGGTVNPSANITRAETACMVYNYAKANKLKLDE